MSQIDINSPDITAVLVTFNGCNILIASVYTPLTDKNILDRTIQMLEESCQRVLTHTSQDYDSSLLVLGDFNRHDQLWGGNDIIRSGQREAEPILQRIGRVKLASLLSRGTKRWFGDPSATTSQFKSPATHHDRIFPPRTPPFSSTFHINNMKYFGTMISGNRRLDSELPNEARSAILY